MTPLRILETSLYVNDFEQAEKFYSNVLGLELFAAEPGRHLFYKCGNQMLLLFNPAKTIHETEVAPHGSQGPGHVAFAVSDDGLKFWAGKLVESGVRIEKEMRWPKGGKSIYFRDPAGNSLEFASPSIWGIKTDNR